MYGQLPLNGLRIFEAAARHLSFQHAAEELHVSPTAISHQIRQLERELGQPLFTRRPLRLTEAGTMLYPVVHRSLALLAGAYTEWVTVSARSELRVSMTHAFASYWLIPRMARFHALHPNVRIKIDATERCVDLGKGEADCAIRYTHTMPEDWVCFPLFRDRFIPICSPQWAADYSERLADLASCRLLHFTWKTRHLENPDWSLWFKHFRVQFPELRHRDDCKDLFFSEEIHAIQAACQGQGLALCSTLMTVESIDDQRLVTPIDCSLPGLMSVLVFEPNHPKKLAITKFHEWLMAEIRIFQAACPAHFFDTPF